MAMKLRMSPREELRLKVFKETTAKKMMNKLRALEEESLPPLTSYANIGQREPPGDAGKHNFKVVHTVSPNSFWVVMADGEDDKVWDEIEKAQPFLRVSVILLSPLHQVCFQYSKQRQKCRLSFSTLSFQGGEVVERPKGGNCLHRQVRRRLVSRQDREVSDNTGSYYRQAFLFFFSFS